MHPTNWRMNRITATANTIIRTLEWKIIKTNRENDRKNGRDKACIEGKETGSYTKQSDKKII